MKQYFTLNCTCGYQEVLTDDLDVVAHIPYVCPDCGGRMVLKPMKKVNLEEYFKDETAL